MKIKIQSPEVSIPAQFLKGFFSSFNAFKILNSHKKLWLYFIIPFIINLILLSAIFYFSYQYIYPSLLNLIPSGDAWYLSIIRWITGPLVILTMIMIFVFLYSITGSIICAPANDLLSGKVEELLTGKSFEEKFSFSGILEDIIRILRNTVKLLLFLMLFNIVIILLNIIPVFGNTIYSILSLLSALFFFGFSFFDFPLERRKLLFRQKFRIIWQFKYYTMGLGFSFFILSFIPILGFLALNLAAAGAAELFVKYIEPNLTTE